MSDDPVHESRRKRSRRAIASYFRRVADALGRGEKVPAADDPTVAVDPPADPDLTVAVEEGDGTQQLSIDVEWAADDGAVDTDAETSKATFEVYEDTDDKWRWRLAHRNGNIIADGGEGYASKQKAKQGLQSVKNNAAGAYVDDPNADEDLPAEGGSDATFELFADSADKWRWRLVHDNGNIIGDGGQGYSSKQKAKQGLRSVQKNAPGAPVTDGE